MDSKSFDNIIKAKLENMSSEATPRWDLFKEKKSAHDAIRADKSFDNDIRRSVSEYTIPYNASHWTILKERLENIYRIRKAIYSIKVYELLAVLLLFYGIGSNYDYIFSIDQTTDQPIAVTAIINNTPKPSKTISQQNITVADHVMTAEVLSPTSATQASNVIRESNNIIKKSQLASEGRISKESNSDDVIDNVASDYNTQDINSNSVISSTSLIVPRTVHAYNSLATDVSDNKGLIDNINTIGYKSASITWDNEEVLINKDLGIKPLHSLGTDGKWLHVAAAFDNNQIHTPFNNEYNPNGPLSTEMYGYTLSGLFSIQKNNFEYETGLGYSVYNKPVSIRGVWDNNIGDVFIYSLSNISFDILSIPLRAKYHFVRNRDWSLFVTGGVTSEFIVNTGYDENNEKLNILAPTPQGGPNTTPTELTESPFRSQSNFHDGFFEGGSFKDNFMLRAQIGAGMERNISPTLSAYISGDFYTPLLNTTYGPTDDSINKFAITFGLKERF